MKTIKLKRYYPHMEEDITLEVAESIAETLSMGGRLCESYRRRKRDTGEYSLDPDAGYESDVIHRLQTPDAHLEKQEHTALYDAPAQLPPVQARAKARLPPP